jgi:hypothetical protein
VELQTKTPIAEAVVARKQIIQPSMDSRIVSHFIQQVCIVLTLITNIAHHLSLFSGSPVARDNESGFTYVMGKVSRLFHGGPSLVATKRHAPTSKVGEGNVDADFIT